MIESYVLRNADTDEILLPGKTVKDFRGTEVTFLEAWPPGTSQGGRGGRAVVKYPDVMTPQMVFPGVIRSIFEEYLPPVHPREIKGTRSFERNMRREKGYDDE